MANGNRNSFEFPQIYSITSERFSQSHHHSHIYSEREFQPQAAKDGPKKNCAQEKRENEISTHYKPSHLDGWNTCMQQQPVNNVAIF